MDFRITGTQDDITAAIEKLKAVFEVLEVSSFYPNRGDSKLGRVYVKVK